MDHSVLRNFVNVLLLVSFAGLAVSCQSTKLFLKTTPVGASVEIYDGDTDTYVAIGKTPIELDLDKIKPGLSEGALRVTHPNYVPERFFLDWQSYSSYELKLKLMKLNENQFDKVDRALTKKKSESPKVRHNGVSRRRANEYAKVVVQVQRLVSTKDYATALIAIKEAIRKDPMIAIFWDLKGSIHLLRGEQKDARASFKRSLKLDPRNPDTISVLTGMDKG